MASFVNQHIRGHHRDGLPQLENDEFLDHLGLVVVSTPTVGRTKKGKKKKKTNRGAKCMDSVQRNKY